MPRISRHLARVRDAEALAMRVRGATTTDIAAALFGGDLSHAGQAVTRALRAIPADDAATMRALAGARLDSLLAAHIPDAQDGDIAHSEMARRLLADQSKLYGLAAPTQVSVTMTAEARVRVLADLLGVTESEALAAIAEAASGIGTPMRALNTGVPADTDSPPDAP